MFLRVKILLDLKKLLARGCTVKLERVETWVPITYEKMLHFCLHCGRTIHDGVECKKSASKEDQNN